MKYFWVTLGVLLIVNSFFMFAEGSQQSAKEPYSDTISQLSEKLDKLDRSFSDRDSMLRIARAEYYLASARHHFDAGWQSKANDYASRGLNLLSLQARKERLKEQYIVELDRVSMKTQQKVETVASN